MVKCPPQYKTGGKFTAFTATPRAAAPAEITGPRDNMRPFRALRRARSSHGVCMKILVLPGDGIGPEISQATLIVLDRANALYKLGLEWQRDEIGFVTLKKEGTTLPPRVMVAARAAAGVLLGPVSHLDYPDRDQGGINPSGEMRVKLDLYANIRPARSRLGNGLTGKPVDLIIFRECTEGFYADRNMFMGIGEFMPTEDMAMAVRRVTAKCCERIARRAFESAMTRRKKVTAVHKANVLRISDGLFLREFRKVAKDFPEVAVDEKIVDAMAALLVRDPSKFDVIVTTNMFGDILSDEASEISGSLGLAGSVMAGDDLCVAQAQHGSAPDIAGRDIANPTSLILSAGMLLEWLARRHNNPAFAQAAQKIDAAIDAAIKDPATRTRDLGGTLGTQAFAKNVAARLG
jgi:3-isopropylmalate dehydrogenase